MVRVVEAVGSSTRGWDAAVRDAVRSARDDAPRPIGVEVTRTWADLSETGRARRFRASVRVAYRQALVRPPGSAGKRATRRASRP